MIDYRLYFTWYIVYMFDVLRLLRPEPGAPRPEALQPKTPQPQTPRVSRFRGLGFRGLLVNKHRNTVQGICGRAGDGIFLTIDYTSYWFHAAILLQTLGPGLFLSLLKLLRSAASL